MDLVARETTSGRPAARAAASGPPVEIFSAVDLALRRVAEAA